MSPRSRILLTLALVAQARPATAAPSGVCLQALEALPGLDAETFQHLGRLLSPEILAGLRRAEPLTEEAPRQSAPRRSGKPEHALPGPVEKLVEWENAANAGALQSSRPFERLEYYEIELSLVEAMGGNAAALPREVRETLVFERSGRKYLRWILHPEDRANGARVEEFLRSKGVTPVRQTGALTGYSTASRTMVVVGANGTPFCLKVGLDRAPGSFKRDKPHTIGDAESAIVMDRYLERITKEQPLKSVVLWREPAAWGIREASGETMAMSVRTMNGLEKGNGNKYYLPGFSALHEAEGRNIAKANGSENPAEFWKKHYAEALGDALGELAARTGVVYDSPHSQNFLVELEMREGKLVPTGRIALRDFGDAYLIRSMAKKNGLADGAGGYRHRDVDLLPVSVGFTQGGQAPKWLDRIAKKGWDEAFFQRFESSFVAGLPAGQREAVRRQIAASRLVGGDKTAQKDFKLPALAAGD